MEPIYVLFGTETYNAQDLAERTGEAIEAAGLAVEVLDMEEVEPTLLTSAHTVLIITSTFGDGEPPSNAEELHEIVMGGEIASLANLRYSVCGLGDTSYPKFCQCAKDFDSKFEQLGAQRIVNRVDCDLDYETPWEYWQSQVLAALALIDFEAAAPAYSEPEPARPATPSIPQLNPPEEVLEDRASLQGASLRGSTSLPGRASIHTSAPPADAPEVNQSPYRYATAEDDPNAFSELATQPFIRLPVGAISPPKKVPRTPPAPGSKKNPYMATVVDNYNLNGATSEKETRHFALSLKGGDVTYKVGDALGLYAQNCPDVVRRLVQGAGLWGDEEVIVGNETLPLRAALTHRLDCVQLDAKLITLAGQTGHGPGRSLFASLSENRDNRTTYIKDHHVLDVVEASWMRPEPQDLVKALKMLSPRLYSISSSPLAHPGEVHLTVDVVRYTLHDDSPRKGIASTFIAERCGHGVKVPIYIHQSNAFGLVDDDYTPIIMVGPGTGIAPFRAFIAEREARKAKGYSWLFFGARTSTTDFLYRSQLEAWHESGVLTRLNTAFSRDQSDKIYVQTRMLEHGADLFAWLEAGSCFYVCGDANRMAKDVNEALIEIVCTYGGYDRAGAEAYLKAMADGGRYQRDVY